ncbi:unnamed protein product [Closterium sp. NIES-53]
MAVGTVAGGAGAGRSGKEAGGEKAASTARLLRTVLSWDFFHMLALSKVRERKRQPRKLPQLPPAAADAAAAAVEEREGDGAKDAALADAEAGGEAAATEGMEVDGGEVGEGEATAEGAAEAAAEEAEVEAEAEGELEGGEEEDELREVPVQFSSAEEYEALVADCHDNDLLLSKEKVRSRFLSTSPPLLLYSSSPRLGPRARLCPCACLLSKEKMMEKTKEKTFPRRKSALVANCHDNNLLLSKEMVGSRTLLSSSPPLLLCSPPLLLQRAPFHGETTRYPAHTPSPVWNPARPKRPFLPSALSPPFSLFPPLSLFPQQPWGGSALPNTYAIASVESRETKTSLRLRLCLEDPWQWADPGGPPTTAAAPDEEQAGGTAAGGEGTEAGPAAGKAKGRRWGVRQRARANRMLSFLMGAAATGGSACWVSKLCNTSTISREYAALRSAPTLPYIRTVLASHMPAPGHTQAVAAAGGSGGAGGAGGGVEDEEEGGAGAGQGKQQQWRVPEGLMEHLSASHNESQLRAIKGGLSRRPLVLIQGPPGTGKTQAILGLLSVVLHGRPAHEMGDASNGAQHITHMTRLTWQQRQQQWVQASPWLHGVNPREAVQPDDEEEGGAGSSGGNVFGSTQQVGMNFLEVSEVSPTSPWLHGVNPRDAMQPDDEEGGDPESSDCLSLRRLRAASMCSLPSSLSSSPPLLLPPPLPYSFLPRPLSKPTNSLLPLAPNQVEVLGGHRKQRAHVLVCAPSNAALDEIVLRLLHTGGDKPLLPLPLPLLHTLICYINSQCTRCSCTCDLSYSCITPLLLKAQHAISCILVPHSPHPIPSHPIPSHPIPSHHITSHPMCAGLRDDIGGIYSPSVVRVGLNAHHSVASVAMDNLVGAWGGWDGRGGVRRRVCYAMDAWRYVCYAMDAWRYVCYAITSPLSPSLLSSSLHFSPLIQDQRISQRASSMAWSATGMGATTTGAHNIFSPSHHNFSSTLSSFPLLPFPLSSLSSPPHRYPSVPAAWRGSGVFSRMSRPFDVVVIDEAAQAVEPSTLIPMTHGCSQVFMVGDPLQLPATVLSTRAVHYGYHGSMFSRLQQAGYPVVMLNTQYRMHPMIRHFPSHEFYGGALRDAPQMAQNTARPWHAERVFGPLFFFDLHQSKDEQPPGGSWMNTDEAEFVMVLYRHLVALYPQLKESSDVGVISPYKHQVKLLRDKFRELLGEGAHRVDVNTVDGFQGREKDVIIFSCVRAGRGKGKSIGFLSDFRRMNVGITRARSSMLVVANAAALMVDEHWGNLVKHARSTNRYLKVSRPFHRIFASDHLEKMRALAHAEGEGEEGASGVAAGGAAAGAPPASAGPAFKKAPTPEDYGGKLDKGDGGVGGEGDTVAEGEGEDEEGQGAMGGEEELEVAVEVGDFDEDNIDGEGSVLFFPCYTSCPSALPPASLVSCF